MALQSGTRLGPYEIISPLGAGGMGEVYRARDTRLGRQVAVKVLPQHVSSSPALRARFEREAKTISSLNHPHICVLHDVGREGETDYLVMELVEGETLAHRLERGPLPPPEVLQFGSQIAAALERAHRAGIVHRDLKPGNIMLTKSGVKLLDFGLARALGDAEAGLANSQTIAPPITVEGALVGTFHYMAPEQLEGKEAGARGDIWALGATLYEMATGQRPFDGASQASLVSSILRDEPRPMRDLVPMSPAGLDRVVRQCLTKDPEERWQSAGDLRRELEWLAASGAASGVTAGVPLTSSPTASSGTSSPTPPPVGAPRPRSRWLLPALPAALVLGALLGAWIVSRNRSGAAPTTLQASILPPPGSDFSSSVTSPIPLAMSPDGSRIVYCTRVGEGPDRLWVRSLGTEDAHELTGTEGAQQPFFSPDSRALGFFADGKLKRIDVDGGPVIALAAAPDPRGGSWSARGIIVFAPDYRGPIFRVAADGGPAVATTVLDSTAHEETHRYPFLLPDGRHFLYLARQSGVGAGAEPTIYAGELDGAKRVRIVGVASNVVYASGHLLYVRQNVLVAQAFDAKRLRVKGAAVSVLPDVRMDERFSRGVFSASQNGILACMVGKESTRSQLLWIDRRGTRLGAVGEPANYFFGGAPEVSPDGTRAALTIVNEVRGQSDVWIVDLASGSRRQLTVGQTDHYACTWGADGRGVFMNSSTGAPNAKISFCATDGSAYRDLDLKGIVGRDLLPGGESPDGRFLLFQRNPGADVLALPLDGRGEVLEIATGPTEESWPQFSPDGRFVSYASDQSGRQEVYVAGFPQSGARWQVSQNGGVEPRWSRDGRELFFFDRENRLNAVEVRPGTATFEPGASRTLFQFHGAGASWRYDTAPDGSRFLVSVPVEEPATRGIVLISNWTAALRRAAQ